MNSIRWQSFMDMDQWFNDAPGMHVAPAVDVYQTDDAVVVKTPLAGVDPDKANISIKNDMLTIEGKTEHKSEVDDKNYYRKEIRPGAFHRAVALSASVKGEKAKAEFDNGLPTVTLPKEERAKPKKILGWTVSPRQEIRQ